MLPLDSKFKLRTPCLFCYVIFAVFLFSSCGKNQTQRWAADDAPVAAQKAMEAQRYADAQTIIEDYLKKQDTPDPKMLSLLGAAYAAQGGVVMISVLKSAGSSGGNNSNSPLGPLASALPPATATNLSFLKSAVTTMRAIDAAALATDMKIQKGIFETCYSFLILKKFLNTAGELDPTALLAMTAEEATDFVQGLGEAASALSGGALPIGDQMSALSTSISESPGETTQQKLAAHFSSHENPTP